MIPCLGEAGYPDFKDGAGVLWQYDVERDCYLVGWTCRPRSWVLHLLDVRQANLWFGGPGGGISIGLIVFCLALKRG